MRLSLAGKAGGGVFQYGRLQGLARLDRQQHGQTHKDDHQDAEDAEVRAAVPVAGEIAMASAYRAGDIQIAARPVVA